MYPRNKFVHFLVWCRESVTDNARNEHKFWYLFTQDLCFICTVDVHFLKIAVKRAKTCWDYKFHCKLRVYTIVLCVLLVLSFIITGNKSFVKYNLCLEVQLMFQIETLMARNVIKTLRRSSNGIT